MEHLFLRHVEEGLYNAVKYCDNVDINTTDACGNTAMHLAAATENIEMLQLLIQRGGNVHAVNTNGESVLHIAIYTGNTDLIRFLIAAGCHVETKCIHGRTPFCIAKNLGFTHICSILLDTGFKHLPPKDDN